MAIDSNLEPRKGAAARKTGDPMTPEGAKAKLSPSGRKGAITGAPLVPEGTKGKSSGSAMENTQKSNVVQPKIVGPMNDEPRISGIVK
jgi:hypothetical protein